MSETCCTRLAENTGRKNDAKNRHLGTIAQLCWAISSELRHISTIGKNLLNSNTFSTCPDNMVNFGILTAEICWRVWGTHANFDGFRVLAALLHGTLVVGFSQTLQQTAFSIVANYLKNAVCFVVTVMYSDGMCNCHVALWCCLTCFICFITFISCSSNMI